MLRAPEAVLSPWSQSTALFLYHLTSEKRDSDKIICMVIPKIHQHIETNLCEAVQRDLKWFYKSNRKTSVCILAEIVSVGPSYLLQSRGGGWWWWKSFSNNFYLLDSLFLALFFDYLQWNEGIYKNIWRRTWQPTPVFLPGEPHGQRSLLGCSPTESKESNMTEAT